MTMLLSVFLTVRFGLLLAHKDWIILRGLVKSKAL